MQTQKEKHETIKINDLESFRPVNDLVLCKPATDNLNYRTEAGIYMAAESFHKDQFLADNANRVVEVVKTPERLSNNRWSTEMELKDGDVAWVSYIEAINCPGVEYEGVVYWLIDYKDFKVAKRGKDVIPLNGFILCEEYVEEQRLLEHVVKKVNKKYGWVAYVGKPNKGYPVTLPKHKWTATKKSGLEDKDGLTEVKKGDLVFISSGESLHPRLEFDKFKTFEGDKDFFLIQRKDIDAVIEK